MSRVALNFLVDVLAAAVALGTVGTGYILRYPLPPGTHRTHTLWGLSRHGWGEVHFWISAALLGVVLIHLVLHWSWIVVSVGRRLGHPAERPSNAGRTGLVAAAALAIGFAVFAWSAHRGARPLDQPRHELGDTIPKSSPHEKSAPGDFWQNVYPVFQKRCESCHGPDRDRGGFRIDRREEVLRTSPPRWVVPGEPDRSRLLAIISGQRPDLPYPDRHQLTAPEVAAIRRWISDGAHWPEHPVR